MKFEQLLEIVGHESVFETGLLLAGGLHPGSVRRQLSRWTKAGRIYQLRRGLYALAPPFQKVSPHPFVIANRMVRGSYVSCQAALSFWHLIPEYVPEVTSVCTGQPGSWTTPLGRFSYHHIVQNLFTGYQLCDLGNDQQAFVAQPEKALLDLIHLHPGGDAPAYLQELRLHLDRLNMDRLKQMASDRPKLQRAAHQMQKLATEDMQSYEVL